MSVMNKYIKTFVLRQTGRKRELGDYAPFLGGSRVPERRP